MGKIIVVGGNIFNMEAVAAPPTLKTVEVIDVLNPNKTCRNLPEFPFPFKSKHLSISNQLSKGPSISQKQTLMGHTHVDRHKSIMALDFNHFQTMTSEACFSIPRQNLSGTWAKWDSKSYFVS